MRFRLSKQEKMGGHHPMRNPSVKYNVSADAPLYMQRAVRFHNLYADEGSHGFKTNQDWPVFWARAAAIVMLMAALMGIAKLMFATLGSPQDWMATLAIMALPAVAIHWVGWLLCWEGTIDILASKVLGVPARPRLYITKGREAGLIWANEPVATGQADLDAPWGKDRTPGVSDYDGPTTMGYPGQ